MMFKKMNCEVCASLFYTEKASQRFCSKLCGYVGRGKGGIARTRVITNCVICKSDFESTPSAKRRFCSKACWNIRGTVELTCKQCGKTATNYKSNKSVFCSKECYSGWQIVHVCGASHPSWKGGSSKHYRRGADWKIQAEKARERDGYCCTRCGLRQSDMSGKRKRLDVHHVIPWSVLPSNELSNLTTLCRKCHIAIEPRAKVIRKTLGISLTCEAVA